MYKVIESQNRYGNCYDVQILVAGDRIDSERIVQYQQYITRQDGRDVILIYTSEMEPVFASGEIRQIASVEKRQFGSAEIRQFESIEKSQS